MTRTASLTSLLLDEGRRADTTMYADTGQEHRRILPLDSVPGSGPT